MSDNRFGQKERALPKSGKGRLFNRRARTAILTVCSILVACFVLIPLILNGTTGANAVYILAGDYRKLSDAQTPVPFLLESESREAVVCIDEPTPAPTPEVQVSQYAELQENDDYPTVKNLQARLMQLGYLEFDEPSTVYNTATTMAVALFQRTLSYDMNGIADSDLQEQLYSDAAAPYEMKLGDSGPDVESMQSRLAELGYYDGKDTGFFGVATEDALETFQAKNGLSVTSIFSVNDRDVLYSPSALPKIDPTPTPSPKPTKKPGSTSTKTKAPTKTPSGATDSGGSSGQESSDNGSSSSGSDASYTASYSASGLISVAKAMLGKPYSWSQESPSKGFDCSGLVYFCLRTCGVSTSRYSAAGFSNVGGWGYVGSIGELQAGDLLFFKSDSSSSVNHTGIYAGGGTFVHASSSSGCVRTSSINTDYWTRNFVNGRRVF